MSVFLYTGVLFCDHRNQFLGYFSGLVMRDKRQDLLVIYCFVQKRDMKKRPIILLRSKLVWPNGVSGPAKHRHSPVISNLGGWASWPHVALCSDFKDLRSSVQLCSPGLK